MISQERTDYLFFSKPFLAFFAGIFFFVMAFGVLTGMSVNMDGEMIGCPMVTDVDLFCDMGLTEHLQMWDSITVTIVQNLPLLLLAAGAVLYFFSLIFSLDEISGHYVRIRNRGAPIWLLFNALKQALSSGILHPKIFPIRS